MKHLFIKSLAVLLIALLLTPAALAEDVIAPVEAIDEAVPEAEFVELDENAELPVEGGFVSGESYQAEMPSYEATGGIPIDEAHFPDAGLRSELLTGTTREEDSSHVSHKVYYDRNRDGWLDTDEIASIKTFYPDGAISDLTGMELMTAMEEVGIPIFTGTTADFTIFPRLMYCSINRSDTLTTAIIPSTVKSFAFINCSQLSNLDISRCTVLAQVIIKDASNVKSLDFSHNPHLERFCCNSKALKSLKLGYQPNLISLICCDNAMTSLDISGCPKLLPVIMDKYKKSKAADQSEPYARVVYRYPGGGDDDPTVTISPTIKLITEKKSETVTPSADNSIVTTAASTKTTADVGKTYTLSAAGQKASGFKSSNKKVATVTKTGKVVPKKAGKVKITYKVNGKTRTVTLTVKDPTMPKSIKLDQSGTVAAKVGDKVTLTATLNEGAKSAITWTTSNKKVATVKNGVVTFKKAGKVTITATTKRGNKKAKVKFTVSK